MQLDILYNIALHSDYKSITSLICAHRLHVLNDYFWQNKYHIEPLLIEAPTISKLYHMSSKEKYVKAMMLTKEIERLLKFSEYIIQVGNRDRIIAYFNSSRKTTFPYNYNHCTLHLFKYANIISLSFKDVFGIHGYTMVMPKDIKQLLFNVLY